MDTFFQFARRLNVVLFVAALVCVASLCLPEPVHATTYSYADAEADCQAALKQASPIYKCAYNANSGYPNPEICFQDQTDNQFTSECWALTSAPSSNPCSSLTNNVEWAPGQVLNGYFTDQNVPNEITGGTSSCRVNLVPVTPPMSDGHGGWSTLMQVNPVTTGPDSSPVSAGQVDNASGVAATPAVPSLPASASSVSSSSAPTLCGGGSCYDPNTGNACAVGAGGQVCIQVQNASGPTGGGCASSGSTTVCAGSPSAPSPVGQPGSTITDPATQVQGSDGYTSANPSSGAAVGLSVSVYSSGGSTSSGSKSSSVSTSKGSTSTATGQSTSPASSSSSGNGDSFNGGGNCNSPPVCQGDAVMCGVAQEAWYTQCNVSIQTTALAGSNPSQQPPTFASDLSKYSQSSVWQQSGGSGSTVGDQANAGSYDQTGFGYATSCPATDLTVNVGPVGSFVVPFSEACVIGPWIYWTVIGFSLYRAARITAGSAI